MISVIFIFLYMFITCYILGFGAWRLMAGNAFWKYRTMRTMTGCVYAGVVVAMAYAQICSLFMKIAWCAGLLLLLLCGLLLFVWRKDFQQEVGFIRQEISIGRAVTMALLFLLFAYGTSRGILHYDTGLYHAQSIRWLEEYGIVKGLGNLHTRLAYNSASFAFSALYSFAFLGGQSFHCGAGFLAWMLATVCVKRLWKKRPLRIQLSDFARICAVYYLFNIYDEMISPASDYFMVLLVFYLVIRWLEMTEEQEGCTYFGYAMMSILGAAAVTVKLSAAAVMLLTLFPAVKMIRSGAWKDIVKFLTAGLFVVLPYLIRNVLLSGWLVYPFTAIDVFDVPYKIPKGVAEYDSREIQVWGRGYTDVTHYSDRFTSWFPDWFLGLDTTDRIFFLLALIGIMCFVGMIWYAIIRKKRELFSGLFVCATVIICFLFWLFTSPLIRYGCIFLWLTAGLNLGMVYLVGIAPRDRGRLAAAAFLLFGCYKLIFFAVENTNSFTPQYFVLQKDYEEFETIGYPVCGYTFYYPEEGDQTGYSSFPSAPQKVSSSIFMGERIEDGFVSSMDGASQ